MVRGRGRPPRGATPTRRGGARQTRARRSAALRLAAGLGCAALLLGLVGCDEVRHRARAWLEQPLAAAPPPRSVKGTLRVSLHGPGCRGEPVAHESTWVPGRRYAGMEDNDLRGFLDGRFIYAWNQPGQVHTRAGRRPSSPRWGEVELFRTLQRWADVRLPQSAEVEAASLRLEVEEGPERPLDLLLYAVHRDWSPGRGGAARDNTSPPEPGDVWWNARAEAEADWGLPGVGYAAERDAEADTPAEPLAEARWAPGDAHVLFDGPALARYAEARATRGTPLLFLIKLSDPLEDRPATLIAFRSASADDAGNPARRPRLTITWRDARVCARHVRALHLEPGREIALPPLAAPGARLLAASFARAPGHEAPTVRVRDAAAEGSPDGWRPLAATEPVGAEPVEARVLAAQQPVELGDTFTSALRDTWVRSGPPESQRVLVTFVSPQGARREVRARYEGDWTWRVGFVPDELGRWRYQVTTRFLEHPVRGGIGRFDVVATRPETVRRGLEDLLARVREAHDARGEPPGGLSPLAQAFWKLERAALRTQTPERWRSEEGDALRALLDAVREALSGRTLPDELARPALDRER